jgi:hypothetical protein
MWDARLRAWRTPRTVMVPGKHVGRTEWIRKMVDEKLYSLSKEYPTSVDKR